MKQDNLRSTQVGEQEVGEEANQVFNTGFGEFINSENDDDYAEYVEEVDEDGFDEAFAGVRSTPDSEKPDEEDSEESTPPEAPADQQDQKEDPQEDSDDEKSDEAAEDEEVIDEEELEGFSDAAIVALSLKEEGELADDFEISKEMSWSDLRDTIKQTAVQEASQLINQQVESIGAAHKYVDFLLKGGDLQTLYENQQSIQLSNLELEGEGEEIQQNIDRLNEAFYRSKDIPEEDIKNLVEDLKDMGKDKERAEHAREYFRQQEEQAMQARLEQERQTQEQQRQAYEQHTQQIQQIISQGKLGDFELNKQEQKALHEAIFVPSETVEYVDRQTGKKVRQKVTKIQLLEQQFQNSPEQQLIFAKLLLDGFKTDQIVSKAISNRDDDLLNYLNGRTTKRVVRKRKRRKQGPGPDIESREVAEY